MHRFALTLVLALGACISDPPRDGAGDLAAVVDAPLAALSAADRDTRPGQVSLVRIEGLDSAMLAEAFARAAAMPRLHSLLVARDGELIREAYFRGRGRDRVTNIKSASKSIISALVGIAIAEGQLEGLDQSVSSFFPEYVGDADDPRLNTVTIGHLLSMQSGLDPTSFRNYGRWVSSRNWVRFVLEQPFVDDPGGRMLYSTGSTHVLSAILTKATGKSTLAYAREKLGGPLGIDIPAWTRDPQGIYFGGNEMGLRPRDMLVVGELYRNAGVHEGRRVLPASWIRDSWTPRTTSPFNGHRYGLGWWGRLSNGYDVRFAWGYGGQFIFVVPELELTIVTTSDATTAREGAHNRALHDLVDELLVPAAINGDSQPVDASSPSSQEKSGSGRG
jgi:CubicO group peptidase (beta-lactamase class C family)